MFNKMILTCSFLLSLSSQTIADTDIRKTCFKPVVQVSENLPQEICFSSLYFDFNKNIATVIGNDLMKEMKYVSEVPRHDDYSIINLTATVYDFTGSACSDSQQIRVNITALFEPMGLAINESAKVTVENESTNDWCHSSPDIETIEYVRVK